MTWFIFSRLLLLFAGGVLGVAAVLLVALAAPEQLQAALAAVGELPELLRSWGASEEVILALRLLVGPLGLLLALAVGFFQSVVAAWLGLWGSLVRIVLGHIAGVSFALWVALALPGRFNALVKTLDPLPMQAAVALGLPGQYGLLLAGMVSGVHLGFVALVLAGQLAVVLALLAVSVLWRRRRCRRAGLQHA